MAELRRLIFSHPYQNALLERFPRMDLRQPLEQ